MTKNNEKLWGGRFSQTTNQLMDAFNASVQFDWRLYPYDIAGSMAHAKMLAKCKIISSADAKKILKGLGQILIEIKNNKFTWSIAREDVHLNIEARLIEMIGPVGGKLHTARSRNDQVALDLRLYTRAEIENIIGQLTDFQRALVKLAEKNVDTLLPGYTHLQRAQPISLAHHLLAYVEMASRDVDRLKDAYQRVNVMPLGSGALAGTTFPIDREFVAHELGFDSVTHNSLDAVSDRDYVIEVLSSLATIAMHLSRLSEEWILWATQEFGFIKLPQEFCTGSSMMPQKINPDVLELIRGKCGRVYGALVSMLTIMKGTPLAYNKDFQEDKEPLFDAVSTVKQCLAILTQLIGKTSFDIANMATANDEGFVLATEVADYLSKKGLPFRDAHRVVGELINHCQKLGKTLETISLIELKHFNQYFDDDVFKHVNVHAAVDRKNCTGGTARSKIKQELKRWKKI